MTSMFEPVFEIAADRLFGRPLDRRHNLRRLARPPHKMLSSVRVAAGRIDGLDATWRLGEARLDTGTLTFIVAGQAKHPHRFEVREVSVLVRDQRTGGRLRRGGPFSVVRVVTHDGEVEWSMPPELVDPALALLRPAA